MYPATFKFGSVLHVHARLSMTMHDVQDLISWSMIALPRAPEPPENDEGGQAARDHDRVIHGLCVDGQCVRKEEDDDEDDDVAGRYCMDNHAE